MGDTSLEGKLLIVGSSMGGQGKGALCNAARRLTVCS